jgi:hypothetical protein
VGDVGEQPPCPLESLAECLARGEAAGSTLHRAQATRRPLTRRKTTTSERHDEGDPSAEPAGVLCAYGRGPESVVRNSTGMLGQGAQCTGYTDCLPGFTCVVFSGPVPNACEQFCRLGLSDCHTGSCTAFGTPLYDTNGSYNQEIGFCQ